MGKLNWYMWGSIAGLGAVLAVVAWIAWPGRDPGWQIQPPGR